MATVPRSDGPQVSIKPLSSARVSPVTSEEAFGGGASAKAVTTQTIGLSETALKIIKQEKAKADDVALLGAKEKELALRNQANEIALKGQGENSLISEKEASEFYNSGIKDIESGLQPSQKFRFKEISVSGASSVANLGMSNTVTQMQKVDKEKTYSVISNTIISAALDHTNSQGIVNAETIARNTASQAAQRWGMPKSVYDKWDAEIVSTLHSSVIKRKLLDGDFESAIKYGKQFSGDILGPDLVQVENTRFEAVRLQKERQVEIDRVDYLDVLGKGPSGRKTTIEYARKMLATPISEGGWTLEKYKAMEARILKKNNDESIELIKRVAIENMLKDAFLGLGTGEGKGRLDDDTNKIISPVRNAKVENIDRFHVLVGKYRDHISGDLERDFLIFTDFNRREGPHEAKKNLWERALGRIGLVYPAAFLGGGNIVAGAIIQETKEKIFKIFDPEINYNEAEKIFNEAMDDFTTQMNPLKSRFPVGSYVTTPDGSYETLRHDEDGMPIIKVGR